jgi:hypothetical protein
MDVLNGFEKKIVITETPKYRSVLSMSWGAKVDFFQQEIDTLSQKPLALDFQSVLEGLGLDGVTETDDAIRTYARTLEWPPVADRVRFELCLRLSCARWYCADMVRFDADTDDDRSGSEFLESLLITYWRDVGRTDWLFAALIQLHDSK